AIAGIWLEEGHINDSLSGKIVLVHFYSPLTRIDRIVSPYQSLNSLISAHNRLKPDGVVNRLMV
ncbi:MAG: hypothetical protein P1U53_09615, partial [Sulfitobacter sp.]|nr:hypothetical protein [Sulfitobacter sp.]